MFLYNMVFNIFTHAQKIDVDVRQQTSQHHEILNDVMHLGVHDVIGNHVARPASFWGPSQGLLWHIRLIA